MKRRPDEKILYALFEDQKALERAYRAIREEAKIKIDDISLLLSEDAKDRDFAFLDEHKTKEGAVVGGIVGSAVGGIVGGMVSLSALATGIGLLAIGPLVGLAAAGGLIGGLAGHGVSEEQADRLHKALHEGHVMMAVHTHNLDDIHKVRALFETHGADEIELGA